MTQKTIPTAFPNSAAQAAALAIDEPLLTQAEADAAHERGLEMAHCNAMEGNPHTPDEIAMFEMFWRERWGDRRVSAYVDETIRQVASGG